MRSLKIDTVSCQNCFKEFDLLRYERETRLVNIEIPSEYAIDDEFSTFIQYCPNCQVKLRIRVEIAVEHPRIKIIEKIKTGDPIPETGSIQCRYCGKIEEIKLRMDEILIERVHAALVTENEMELGFGNPSRQRIIECTGCQKSNKVIFNKVPDMLMGKVKRMLKTSMRHETINKKNFKTEFDALINLLNQFNKVAKQLENRYDNRHTLSIKDEYDVQDLLAALLLINFSNVRKEEYNPSFANTRSRIDFLLKEDKIGLEVKIIRDKSHAMKIKNELIQDKEYYSTSTEIRHLVFFIYDPQSLLLDRDALINDLKLNISPNFVSIHFIIKPDL